MRINVMGTQPAKAISGGRLLSWLLAESLGASGYQVTFVTDNVPAFYQDFAGFSKVTIDKSMQLKFELLHKVLKKTGVDYWPEIKSSNLPKADYSIIVPQAGQVKLHQRMLHAAKACSDKVVLLNFETPNWFNSVSPFKKRNSDWYGWELVAQEADLILSISGESQRYAKEFYLSAVNAKHVFYYTAINSVIADEVVDIPKRERQIVCISRNDPHKGLSGLGEIFTPAISGSTFVLIIGSQQLQDSTVQELKRKAAKYDINVVIRSKVTEHDKFQIIKQSSVMVFPSFFEGFGMPPLEALYCKTPVVAFELPVLAEYSAGNIVQTPAGDYKALSVQVGQVLDSYDRFAAKIDNEYIQSIARVDSMKSQLTDIFV